MSEKLAIRLQSFGMPQNVERVYATKVGGVSATLTHFGEKAKTAVSESGGLVEIELSAETPGPSGVNVSGSEAKKSLINVNRVEDVVEY